MPRPRSHEKRAAILEAATRIIVAQGLSAPTMVIAREAGIANGSLFTYFETKADLFNQLYLELKAEMASAIFNRLPLTAELHGQFFHAWRNWTNWALSNPQKRRVLAQLSVSDEITSETRVAVHKSMLPVVEMLERGRANGPMQKAPMGFVVAIMNAVAESTMDCMVQDPKNASKNCRTGFDALWRILA
jgi:AcrR family transcriptional regulator